MNRKQREHRLHFQSDISYKSESLQKAHLAENALECSQTQGDHLNDKSHTERSKSITSDSVTNKTIQKAIKASLFVKTLLEINPDIVVALIRVSGRTQKYKGNMDRQETSVIKMIEKAGVKIADIFTHQGSSKLSTFKTTLIKIFKKMQKQGIKYLVIVTLSRIIRNEKFDPINNPDAEPTSEELKILKELAEKYGIQLLTIADPDLTLSQDRSFLNALSSKTTSKKNINKKEAMREVIKLHEESNWGCRRIAKHITVRGYKVSSATVARWCVK